MPAFYDGQQDYIQKLNELYAYFMAGPFNAVPLAGGVVMTGPLTIPTLTIGSGGATGPAPAAFDNTTRFVNASWVNQRGLAYKPVNGISLNAGTQTFLESYIGAWLQFTQPGVTLAVGIADAKYTGSSFTVRASNAGTVTFLGGIGVGLPNATGTASSYSMVKGQVTTFTSLGTTGWFVTADSLMPSEITKTYVGLGNVDNTSDVNKPVSTAQAAALALKTSLGQRNRIDNSNFTVNQLGVSGTVTLAAGAYGHDRWKAGAAGCTYTFSQSQGVVTLNITAGTLVQVVDGSGALRGTGTYVTSWTGTAQGRFGASAYAASGFTTSLTGGTNATLEFGIGTLSQVQTEIGTSATPYEVRTYADEYARCRWYFKRDVYTSNTVVGVGQAYGTGTAYIQIPVPNDMRPSPTVSLSGGLARLGGEVVGAPGAVGLGPSGVSFTVAWSSTPFVSGDSVVLAAASTFTVSQDSNL